MKNPGMAMIPYGPLYTLRVCGWNSLFQVLYLSLFPCTSTVQPLWGPEKCKDKNN